MDILFYCGLNEKNWNHHPIQPGTHVCIAPCTSGTRIAKNGEKKRVLRKTYVNLENTTVRYIMIDSCAFSERLEVEKGIIVKNERLSFKNALERQITHAKEFNYTHLVESIVSYDVLIDETWKNGERKKERWSIESADYAVNETIKAAQFLDTKRKEIDILFGHHIKLVLSAQGVNAEQYQKCTQEILKIMNPDDDIFGLGGWCISGLRREKMIPLAAEIFPSVFELLGQSKVKRVHVFGVIFPKLLGFLLYLSKKHNIQLSTDSSGPCVNPAKNAHWGYGSWTDPTYKGAPVLESCKVVDEQKKKIPTCLIETRCRGNDRILHTQLTIDYLQHFSIREPSLVTML